MKDRESVFEIGMLLLGMGIVAGAGALFVSRVAEAGGHRRRRGETPPPAGTIKPSQHQHISTVAAR